MEILVITSKYHKQPLAEIRTDGSNIEWIFDATDGKLNDMAQGDINRLKEVIGKSSYLDIHSPEDSSVGMLRYMMENGDIVEVTTDGKTAILNGMILDDQKKKTLMQLINSGKLKVKTRARLEDPVTVAVAAPIRPDERKRSKYEQLMTKEIEKNQQEEEARESLNSKDRDYDIESMDFSELPNPEFGRQLMYLLKYGE